MIRVRCPICDSVMEGESTSSWPDFPFCSSRCRLIDLGRWLDEGYRLPAESADAAPPEAEETGDP